MAYRDVSFLTFSTHKDPDAPYVRFEPDETDRITAFLLAHHVPRPRERSAVPAPLAVVVPPWCVPAQATAGDGEAGNRDDGQRKRILNLLMGRL